MTERQLFMIALWVTLAIGLALYINSCAVAPHTPFRGMNSNEGQWSDPRLEQRLSDAIDKNKKP